MTNENTAVVTTGIQSVHMTMKQITDRVNLVHDVLNKVMIKGTHYGTVPGCGDKMVLLKPGADVLAMTFRLVPQFTVNRTDVENGHREYDVTCSMYGASGELLGQGVGSASTMEKKYRYRKDSTGKKIENEDIADVYNTVLKMAKKRAHVDATLTVTGAGDLFTQDLIDEDETPKQSVAMPKEKKPEPTPAPAAQPVKTDTGWEQKEDCISEKQAKRLFAICNKASVTHEVLKRQLEALGISHTNEIKKGDEYDEICQWAEAGGQEPPNS